LNIEKPGCVFDFEFDFKDFIHSKDSVDLPIFEIHGVQFHVLLKLRDGKWRPRYDCILRAVNSAVALPFRIPIRFDIVDRTDGRVIRTTEGEFEAATGYGRMCWIDMMTVRSLILEVKIGLSFSDLVELPAAFDDHGSILFDRDSSDISFIVGEAVVYANRKILSSRYDYFREMMKGSFKEAQVTISSNSEIPIQGVNVGVFKMIIEWIYTMDIQRLNSLSLAILADLERVYVAADMYLLPNLCDSIVKYLESLINQQTFGEIYQIATRIGRKTLEDCVLCSWISNSDEFNKNEAQIDETIKAEQTEDMEGDSEEMIVGGTEEQYKPVVGEDGERDAAAILGISKKMIRVSIWEGDKDRKFCMIQYIASSMNL
jgi:hypothetical protein